MVRKYLFNHLLRDVKRHQHFRSHWQFKRNVKISISAAIGLCKAANIPIYQPEQLFTTHTNYLPVQTEKMMEKVSNSIKTYVIDDRSKFLTDWGVPCAQHMTNTYVYKSLPSLISNIETEESEIEKVKRSLEYSQLLNSNRVKIATLHDPNIYDNYTIKKIAIPRTLRMESMSLQMLSLLNKVIPIVGRRIRKDICIQNKFNYNDSNVLMQLNSNLHITANKALRPILNTDEVKAISQEPHPDIYPLSPLANFDAFEEKDINFSRGQSVLGGHGYPHTVFVHKTVVSADFNQDKYASLALTNVFNIAASYARKNENHEGDLEYPFTVNVVLHNGRHFQFGVFQLNTLNLAGPTKNVFWYEPMEMMFSNVSLDEAKPYIHDYNPRPYEVLKRMYSLI